MGWFAESQDSDTVFTHVCLTKVSVFGPINKPACGRINTVRLTDTNARGSRKNSSVLLFMEDGPNGFDGLRPTQEGVI
jgi:hypothetical protein